MAYRAQSVVFFQAYVETCSPPKLEDPPVGSYLSAPILIHMKKQGIPINMPRGMTDTELESAISAVYQVSFNC